MDKEAYRKQYESNLKEADEEQAALENALHTEEPLNLITAEPSNKPSTKAVIDKLPYVREQRSVDLLIELVNNESNDPGTRAAALQTLSLQIGQTRELIDWVLSILKNKDHPAELRLASFIVLKQISFSSEILKPTDPEFIAVLRSIVNEGNGKLRENATEMLALNNDKFVQDKLVAGLKNESEPLVSPQKAIKLLGNDIHGNYFPLLRDIVKNPPNTQSKIEAIKVLAADKNSMDTILETLNNREESHEVRSISALAYQSADPLGFSEYAKTTILNQQETDELRQVVTSVLSKQVSAGIISLDLGFKHDLHNLQFRDFKIDTQAIKRMLSDYNPEDNSAT
jgi:hypothetical protein